MLKFSIHDQSARRILILDGGLGTMIQGYGLSEEDYRGTRFADWKILLKGCNDLLVLTRPQVIAEIHEAYLKAGADIISTDTFNASAVSMADYGLEAYVYEMNRAAAALARKVADGYTLRNPSKPRFVAGSIGPTNRTASISPDVNNPGYRAVTFDDLRASYAEQVRGLLDGGADVLLIETIFDTLNAKAALFAIEETFAERGRRIPGDGLRNHHRRQRTDAVRANDRGFLRFDRPCESFFGRTELRLRRRTDAALHRTAGGGRRVRRIVAPERRTAERLRRLRRNARNDGGNDRNLPGQRPAEHRRRMLRHDAGTHRRHRASRIEIHAARNPGTGARNYAQRTGNAADHARS